MDCYGAAMRRYKENLPEAAAGMKTRMIPTLKRAILTCLLLIPAAGAVIVARRLGLVDYRIITD